MMDEMQEEEIYIPDWYVAGQPAGVHNVKNIRRASEEALERMSY